MIKIKGIILPINAIIILCTMSNLIIEAAMSPPLDSSIGISEMINTISCFPKGSISREESFFTKLSVSFCAIKYPFKI